MTYAGLLSYIYADLKPDDPRVTSAMDWLRGNYTVDENPALGPARPLLLFRAYGQSPDLRRRGTLETKDGRKVNWREDLALKFLNLQHADGSWANENGRWWEKDPVLDSAYRHHDDGNHREQAVTLAPAASGAPSRSELCRTALHKPHLAR